MPECELAYLAGFFDGEGSVVLTRRMNQKERAAYAATYRERAMALKATIKLEVLNAYGGPRCSCCGETLVQGLTIDHINGDGAVWRRENKHEGSDFYRWLKKNRYPPGFQVLCATCNLAKGTSDHCPHRDAKAASLPAGRLL